MKVPRIPGTSGRRIVAGPASPYLVAIVLATLGLVVGQQVLHNERAQAPAYSAARSESPTFNSLLLGRAMPYYVFLPPGYDSGPARRYPVLYMLHGIGNGDGGTNSEWLADGLFDQARVLMERGEIQPFIIVLPQGDESYWMDWAGGGPQWGAYTAREVVGEIDSHYRTIADAPHRAIGGLSMGADGALQLAMTYPDVFGVVGAHSLTLRGYETAPPFYGDLAYFQAHDPVSLYRADPDRARSLEISIDIGQDDEWLPSAMAFHLELMLEGVPHAWHVYPGNHNPEYWTAHVPDYLRFYGRALAGGV